MSDWHRVLHHILCTPTLVGHKKLFCHHFVCPVHCRLRSTQDECRTDKSVDNTAQIGQIADDDDRHYFQAITDFVQWCDENFLDLMLEDERDYY